MYALFDDAGKFQAGRVMSEADSSMQVELDSGKRVKVKAANVLIRFAKPAPADLLAQGAAQATGIDVDLVWEVAPEDEFGFDDLAREYFSDSADAVQQAAMLMCLFEHPQYFHRRGKGRFRKAPEDILKQALAAIERKKQQALQIAEWAQALAEGACPAPIKEQLYKILFKPDKNGPEYKAVVEAAKLAQRAPLDLLKAAGAIDSPYQFHFKRFLFEHFPKGSGFPALDAPPVKDELPLAAVQAFSIDDSMTTEIDDALSIQGLGTGTVTFGIHIAAPGLAITPATPLDALARGRMSTVYMPGHKITMLPDEVVQAYTLIEGRDCPAVSLYVTLDEATLAVTGSETRLERVPIVANLRHDKLDTVITDATLSGEAPADYPFASELAFCFRLARHLKAQREVVRGKPENFNRPDYSFKLIGANGENTMSDGVEPDGTEQVVIGTRQRGSALDLIVAEAMILANSTWGGWLAELGVPGIYRSQASLAPGIKVRMGTKPLPHAGMGVAQYTWATSPLRRYVDLVNQWQIIACARHGRTAALAAPFKPKDAELFAVISNFDAAYSAYNGFQSSMERYWTLKYLGQQGLSELDCAVMVNGLVRAETLPLVFKAIGADGLPRHTRVRVRITGVDELTLDVHASVVARLDDATAEGETEGDEDDAVLDNAGPLTLAIDVNDADAPAEGNQAAAA
ncbi:RNB domain-containing ribonuclease [Aquabacterium fontiphilum]|jgi:exoribonuclease-2|uniref:ribonuclease catalytic domain-containing protein n=1 Tax=Aquabacterium fontiphilum TaxID=450365 RepID=UPI001376E8D8|nr:ribonuclease catalytic domain-containing protein [Aquabacterium fontiphilum]NBD20825.1 RNB domain-containing ribonuclease [Aquabacterium fontiphilum]